MHASPLQGHHIYIASNDNDLLRCFALLRIEMCISPTRGLNWGPAYVHVLISLYSLARLTALRRQYPP
jgi:hypothetical protein